MTAQPLAPPWYQPKPPFTVDTLYDLPQSDLCHEVLEGQLVVSPTPTPAHNLAADRIRGFLMPLLPLHVDAITAMAVRMSNGDGPVPDLLVTSGDPASHERGLPATVVHTVIEVVSPSSTTGDRRTKAGVYAAGGIPCYWRVELRSWKDHFGPVPAIVVRLLADGEVTELLFAAGSTQRIPLAIGAGPELTTVQLDPAWLVGARRAR